MQKTDSKDKLLERNNQHAIIVGSSCSDLGWKIADKIIYEHDLISPKLKVFKNGERFCDIESSVRGKICFVIQTISKSKNGSINDNLMELVVMVDALKRASALSVIAVIPFLGYSRQDRRQNNRVPISSRVVADILQSAGIDHIMTMDLHSMQGEGYYKIPFDNISALELLKSHAQSQMIPNEDYIVISPDIGGVARARSLSVGLNLDLAIIDKRRDSSTNEAEVMNLIGNVEGKNCIILDDMVDTGGTLLKAAKFLKDQKAKNVIAMCTHGVFSDNGLVKILDSQYLDKIVCTDSMEIEIPENNKDKLVVLSNAELIAANMARIIKTDFVNKNVKIK